MKKWLLIIFCLAWIMISVQAEILFHAAYDNNLKAVVGGKEISPSGGSGVIAESDGKTCLQAWGKFRTLKYACRAVLPEKNGAVDLEFYPQLAAKQQNTGQMVAGTFFSTKSSEAPDYAGFTIGANIKEGGKVYLFVNVKGKENAQIYREVSMPDGKWYKIVASWSETTLSLFLDGKLIGDVKRPAKLFADVDISIGGYGGSIAEGGIRNVKIYDRSPFVAPTDNITFEFPEKKGNVSLFKHTGMSIASDRLAMVLQADQPLNVKIKTAVFEVKPNQGYAVNFSCRPHGFFTADAAGVLTIPLLTDYTYNTIVAVPADITNLLSAAEWHGQVDNVSKATLEWGHEGGDKVASDAVTDSAGTFSRDSAISRSGQPALKLEKLVRDGEVRYQSSPVKLTPDKEYLLSGYYHTVKPEFGAAATFGIEVRCQDGVIQKFNQENFNPLIAPILGKQWYYAFVRFKAPAGVIDGVVRLCLRGTAGQQLWWDDLSLRSAPPVSANILQELPMADTAPALTVEQVRDYWSKRGPVKVETVSSNGLPVLHIDGKPVPSLVYNTYVVASKESEIKPMLNAGIRWYFIRIHANAAKWRLGKNQYDFKEIQSSIESALQQDRNAVIMLSTTISPRYHSWGEENPDGIWRDHDGDKIAGYKSSIRKREQLDNKDDFWAHSYSADSFRESAAEALLALVAHLKTFDAGKAVAGMQLLCGTDNQWFPHVNYKGFDYSSGAQKDFRQYLKEVYNNDVNVLRQAWRNNNVSFDNAELAPFNLRNRDNVWFLNFQNGTDRWIFDSNCYNDVGAAKTADYLGSVVKKAFGYNVFINLYSPDIMQGYCGRSARKIILEGKGIDGIVGVPEYGNWRQPGRTGNFSSTAGSAGLHNKIFLSELDYRTHTCWISADAFHYLYYEHGGVLNEQEFAGQARRDVGTLLAQGQGAWFLAMNRLLFNTAEYRSVIKELAAAAKMAADKPMPLDRGQMAVFIDENIRNATAYPYGPALNNLSIGTGKIPLLRSGVSWDSYYLSDLENPRRFQYKVNLFAAAPTITKTQIEYVRKNLQKDGNVLVFVNAAGITSDAGTFEKNIQELTGMKIKYAPDNVGVFRIKPVPVKDRIADGLKDNIMTEMRQPLFFIDDPDATVFGKINGTDKAGWAVKRFKDWTSIYIALPGAITPELVRNIVREAGIEPIGPCDDVTTAGNGFITIHAISDGEKKLKWVGKCDIADLISGEIINNADMLSFQMKTGETRWFRKQ